MLIPLTALYEDFDCGDDVPGLFPYQSNNDEIYQAGWVYSRYSIPMNQYKRELILIPHDNGKWMSQKVVAWDGTPNAIRIARGYVHDTFDFNPYVVSKAFTLLQRQFRSRH